MIRTLRLGAATVNRLFFRFDEFKCTIPVSQRLDFVVYECPGAWCDEKELSDLVADLRAVTQAGQNGKPIPRYGPLTGDRADLRQRIIAVAYDRKLKKPVGFSAQAYIDVAENSFRATLVHLGLIYVDPSYQGHSVSYMLSLLPNFLILIKSGFRDTWVSSVSQVPAVVGLVATNYYQVFPSHQPEQKQSFLHRKLGMLIMKNHRAVFGVSQDAPYLPDEQIILDAYRGGSDAMKKSFSEATKHRLPAINELCRTRLNYERGDDFLQLGKLGFSAFTNLFRSKMENMNAGQIFFNLLILSCARSVLPLLRWLLPKGDAHLV